METSFVHTKEEATATPKFPSKEEQCTMKNPKYSSREESEVATSTRKEGRPQRLPPYITPHKIFNSLHRQG